MKRKHILIMMIAALGLLLLGCMKEEDPPPNKPVPTPTDRYPEPTVTIPSTTTTTRRSLIDDYNTTTSTTSTTLPTPIVAPPTTAPPTTLSSAINGQCGTVIETCAAGKYINTPDASDTARWLCQGKNGGSSVSCSQRFPTPTTTLAPEIAIVGSGPLKLMLKGKQVGNAAESVDFDDETITTTIVNIICEHEDKAKIQKLMPTNFYVHYWGTDTSFCVDDKAVLLAGTSRVTFSIAVPTVKTGYIKVYYKTLGADDDRRIHMDITPNASNKINLGVVMLLYVKLLKADMKDEGTIHTYNKNGVKQ